VRDLPPDARLALYRVAQEALTNVRKHTAATSVRLTLCYGDGGVELTVEDEGTARGQSAPGGGFGLSGMRERAELLGARLEAGPVEGGFRVCLWIPS
jgi:signal transduction histidine kinase